LIENAFEQFTKKHYPETYSKNLIFLKLSLKMPSWRLNGSIQNLGVHFPTTYALQSMSSLILQLKLLTANWSLVLNGRNAPELHISKSYNEMLLGYKASKEKSKAQKEAVLFIKQKLDAAKWFIDAIRQRQQTLLLTMSAIMHYQKAYFLSGDEEQLRPMILKDIADEIRNGCFHYF